MAFFSRPVETMPREHLQAYQMEKLRGLLGEIIGPNRFYTEKYRRVGVIPEEIDSFERFQRLPFTTKMELSQAQEADLPFGTNTTYAESEYTRFHQTSGTTGKPLRVVDTAESWEWWGDCWGYVLAAAGVTSEDRLFLPFSFGPFIGFWASVLGAKRIGAMLVSGGGHSSLQRLHLMRELQVTAICCTPTYALRLAEVARENQFELSDIPIRATIHAGEPGANVPATKRRIEAVWNAHCYDHAGASEIGAHSFECELQPGGIHIIESEFIAEVVHPGTGESVADGEEGELILTNLGRVGYPVIRYRTGDLVRYTAEPCQCGRTFGRLDGGIIGRVDDMVVVRGMNIFPSVVEDMIREFDIVDEFRVSVSKKRQMAELGIELELKAGSDAATACLQVQQAFQTRLGLRPEVISVPRNSLPRFELKAKRFYMTGE